MASLSLSDIARIVDLPRRTVQYWADHDVLQSDDLELASMLVPFANMSAPIGLIKTLARVLRTTVLEHKLRTKAEAEHFGRYAAAARRGEPAVLAIKIIPMVGTPSGFTFQLKADRCMSALAGWMETELDMHTRLPIVVLNLAEALRPRVTSEEQDADVDMGAD